VRSLAKRPSAEDGEPNLAWRPRPHTQGVDFFFGNRAHALKFIDFVGGAVPIRHRADKQLVSHNEHAATYNYKYTFSVEIVPVCKVHSPPLHAPRCTVLAVSGARHTGVTELTVYSELCVMHGGTLSYMK
jgi:hypothetical protein